MLKLIALFILAVSIVACGDRPTQLACPSPDVRLDAGNDTKVKPSDTGADVFCSDEQAGCPPLVPGDVFVVRCKPMMYIMNKQYKALYFPMYLTDFAFYYHTWRINEDNLLTVSQSCFDSLSVPSHYPGGVNFRPGSFIIMRQAKAELYVIEPGNTRAKITPQIAADLYKNPTYPYEGIYDTPIVVPDAFWPHLVNVGPDIVDVRVHPGMLFMVDQTTYYADTDGSIRVVTDAGFKANHFQRRFVRRVESSAISGMPIGKTIDGLIPEIDDPTQGG